jgi:TPR repeat protein
LRFKVRSIAWPHYERGVTLLDLYPHQRNDPDRFRTLEAAQQELEAYLAARPADATLVADAHYHLGAIAELRAQPQAALVHYRLAAAAGHLQARERLAALEAEQ